MNIKTTVTGFPRIGENRELKKALESYWAGNSTVEELHTVSTQLKNRHWLCQQEAGIDLISCNDFSWYDSMLDTMVMLNAVPKRFRSISDKTEQYFAMARGRDKITAMEMTKWFNTNYHYIVPELSDDIEFSLNTEKIDREYNEIRHLNITPKINIIGPLTFLGLSKEVNNGDPYTHFQRVLEVYSELVEKLSFPDNGVYLQFDEPVFAGDTTDRQKKLLEEAYSKLGSIKGSASIIVTTYFDHSCEATEILAGTPVRGIGLDLVHGKENLQNLSLIGDKKLVAGIVDGRNIWRNDIPGSAALLNEITKHVPEKNIIVSTSCSLLHVPYSLKNEHTLGEKKNWLSFALEKLNEVTLISKKFRNETLTGEEQKQLAENDAGITGRKNSTEITNSTVQERLKTINMQERPDTYEKRIKIQKEKLAYPLLPTTTIGSFPQTPELRKLRRDFKNDKITSETYETGIKKYIDDCIAFQEEVGLDILVHGEPERNDMVEYFGELLDGFAFTVNGWVQSYGSRCVKPPVIYGDIDRPAPMTVDWITYAQGKTTRPVKGMLTGPVTILNWSFVRDDIERSMVARQIALALSDEILDLQEAGIKIIQVDEAAFKEGYPLRKEKVPEYEKWAVNNFKLAVSTARAETQIHTHMCYSDFNKIIGTIQSMDADVITIETARSGNDLLNVFFESGYTNEIGPGVYDIHSPRIPPVDEIHKQITSLLEALPKEQLWINPDCGLKTRKWEEVRPALHNLVEAAKRARNGY